MSDDESSGSDGLPDVSASLIGSGWDALKSGADAIGDMAEASFYATGAATEAALGGSAHIGAGVLDAFGAEGLAAETRDGANILQDQAYEDIQHAGRELGEVVDDISGT